MPCLHRVSRLIACAAGTPTDVPNVVSNHDKPTLTHIGKCNFGIVATLATLHEIVTAGQLGALQTDLEAVPLEAEAVSTISSSCTSCTISKTQTTLHVNPLRIPTSAQSFHQTMHHRRRTLLTSSCTDNKQKTDNTTALGTAQWLAKTTIPTYLNPSKLLRCC